MAEQKLDCLGKTQADLVDLSGRLNILAWDFQQLAAALPAELNLAAANRQAALGVAPTQPQPPAVPGQQQASWQVGAPWVGPQPGYRGAGVWVPVSAGHSARVDAPPQGSYSTLAGPPPPVGHRPQSSPQRPAFAGQQSAPPPVFVTAAPKTGKPGKRLSIAEVFSIVGSVITLLGVAFVLLLPDNGFVNQGTRAGIGLGLALVAAAAALWQHRVEPSNTGGHTLMATGVASAFLSVLALTALFRHPDGSPLLGEVFGLIAAGAIGLGGVAVARWWRSQWLAVLAVLGSLLLAPFLSPSQPLWPLAFMVVMTLVTAAFQHQTDWVVLLGARVVPTSAYFAIVLLTQKGSLDPLAGLGLAVVLAAGGLGTAVLHQWGSARMRAVSVASMVVMTTAMMLAIWTPPRYLAVALAAGLGLAFATVGLFGKVFAAQLRAGAVPMGAILLVLAMVRLADGEHLGYLFFALAAIYFAIAAANRFRPVLVVAWALALVGVFHWVPTVAGVFLPISSVGVEQVTESVLGLVATLLAVRAVRAFGGAWGAGRSYLSWAASVIFGSVAVIVAGAAIGFRIDQPSAGFQAAHALTTVAWLLLSVVLLRLGLRRNAEPLVSVRLAIALAIAAVAKLFLFDLSALPDLARALAFLAAGVVMLIIGTWYHKQLEKARKAPAAALGVPGSEAAEAAASPASAATPNVASHPCSERPDAPQPDCQSGSRPQ